VFPYESVLIYWKPPGQGWFKLNSDGFCSDNRSKRCNGVIRGSDGEWFGDFSKNIDMYTRRLILEL